MHMQAGGGRNGALPVNVKFSVGQALGERNAVALWDGIFGADRGRGWVQADAIGHVGRRDSLLTQHNQKILFSVERMTNG